MTRIAMCVCGEPLVFTMIYRKFEFICVHCGRHATFFGPIPADETPELLKRTDENKAEWDRLSEGMFADGAMLLDSCPVCKKFHEPHSRHASDEEVEADRAARERVAAAVPQR